MGKCNFCGQYAREYRWLCPLCKERREIAKSINEICQNCGHHLIDHYAYEPRGRCCVCTCSSFQGVVTEIRKVEER